MYIRRYIQYIDTNLTLMSYVNAIQVSIVRKSLILIEIGIERYMKGLAIKVERRTLFDIEIDTCLNVQARATEND